MFFALKDIEVCNFADDTTPFVCDLDLNTTLNKLEEKSAIAPLIWFDTNYMKLNIDKCLLIPSHHFNEMFTNIRNNRIWGSENVELLGVTINKDLNFCKYVNKICSKANRKLNVLSRIQSFLFAGIKRIALKSFIESQFKYCPLTCFTSMFCIRRSNNKINRLHERSLRIYI